MKALSLHQPWATFIALGWKTIETRAWSTPYRGRVAIHAAKTTAHVLDGADLAEKAGLGAKFRRFEGRGCYPVGQIVAVATITDVFRVAARSTLTIQGFEMTVNGRTAVASREERVSRSVRTSDGRDLEIPPADLVLGDLSVGRCGFRLENVVALAEPVAARGLLGLFTLPADIERAVLAQLGLATEGAARG